MAEESPFQHHVEICDMIWFPQVGLVYNGNHDGFQTRECHNPIVGYVRNIGTRVEKNYPGIYTVHGELAVRDHIRDWLEERGWEYEFGRTPCISSPACRLIIKFKERDQAILFKLTWAGGNV